MKNNKVKLSQPQRFFVAAIYLVVIFFCVWLLGENPVSLVKGNSDASIWFLSGVLLIIMGQYVSEPFFSTPADAFANSVTAILALIAVNNKGSFKFYRALFVYCVLIGIMSIIAIGTRKYDNRFSRLVYLIVNKLGSSKILFSLVYLLSAFSYFLTPNKNVYLTVSIVLWFCIVFLNVGEHIVSFISTLFKTVKEKPESRYLGQAVKSNNQTIYSIEINKHGFDSNLLNCKAIAIKATDKDCYIGIVLRKQTYFNTYYLEIMLIDDRGVPKTIPIKELFKGKSYGSHDIGSAFSLSDELCKCKTISDLLKDEIVLNINSFIGLIKTESDINIIRFSIICNKDRVKEGQIVKVKINGKDVLYQIINGITKESLDNTDNSYGYVCGEARKLGTYNYSTNLLNTVPWVPNTYEKVYLLNINIDETDYKQIAQTSIGILPGTDMTIPIKDVNNLVTHNTAVLGILGVGKSCLTFELIKKIISSSDCKVICIDITNQYFSDEGLFQYVPIEIIQNDFKKEYLESLNNDATKSGKSSSPSEWGNLKRYYNAINYLIDDFYKSDKRILIINPDNHVITQAMGKYNIEEVIELTTVEKTRIITEKILSYCMDQGQTNSARCALVLEEAHSLVPEWNSASSSGDQVATNGTAKVILQGRKYGLGCIVVTQRTANITKSILNQCNTIFAMRVFDETGKNFLENYIGNDYSSVLPTLEERQAIVIGKSLGLKQPIIIQLNDKQHFNKSNI